MEVSPPQFRLSRVHCESPTARLPFDARMSAETATAPTTLGFSRIVKARRLILAGSAWAHCFDGVLDSDSRIQPTPTAESPKPRSFCRCCLQSLVVARLASGAFRSEEHDVSPLNQGCSSAPARCYDVQRWLRRTFGEGLPRRRNGLSNRCSRCRRAVITYCPPPRSSRLARAHEEIRPPAYDDRSVRALRLQVPAMLERRRCRRPTPFDRDLPRFTLLDRSRRTASAGRQPRGRRTRGARSCRTGDDPTKGILSAPRRRSRRTRGARLCTSRNTVPAARM